MVVVITSVVSSGPIVHVVGTVDGTPAETGLTLDALNVGADDAAKRVILANALAAACPSVLSLTGTVTL